MIIESTLAPQTIRSSMDELADLRDTRQYDRLLDQTHLYAALTADRVRAGDLGAAVGC